MNVKSSELYSVLEQYLQHMWSGREFNWMQPLWIAHLYGSVRKQSYACSSMHAYC